jgi:hypothetical protein
VDCEPVPSCEANCNPVPACETDCNPQSPASPSSPSSLVNASGEVVINAVDASLPVVIGVGLPPAAPIDSTSRALLPAGAVGGFVPPTAGDGGLLGRQPASESSDVLAWSLLFPMFALVGVSRRGRTRD